MQSRVLRGHIETAGEWIQCCARQPCTIQSFIEFTILLQVESPLGRIDFSSDISSNDGPHLTPHIAPRHGGETSSLHPTHTPCHPTQTIAFWMWGRVTYLLAASRSERFRERGDLQAPGLGDSGLLYN